MSDRLAEGIIALIWGGFSASICLMYAIPAAAAAVFLVVWIVALADLVQRDPADFPQARSGHYDPNERMLWVIAVVLGGAIGALLYYLMVMKVVPRPPRQEGPQ
jgi:drug/metabolite transporter (DMT)-like permease